MHIYFIGIGGTGLSSLAQLALDSGYIVSGSDIAQSLGSQAVEDRGVAIGYVQDGCHIKKVHEDSPIDWVVYSAACPPDHPELRFAQDKGIKITKRDGLINHILEQKKLKLIAIAGTHGKTTTTAMVTWVFKQLHIPISYLIGSNISFGPSASYQDGSQYFVLEADEFDKHFLNYHPEYSIITNVDFDHSDVYTSQEDYNAAFSQFMSQSRQSIVWDDDRNVRVSDTTATVQKVRQDSIDPRITLLGNHNRQNAHQVLLLMQSLGYESAQVIFALNTYPGSQRRMEKIGENIYTDYAHHPTEIAASLQMLHEKYNNIVVIYQPHQNLRQHELLGKYGTCFELAQKVYWLPTYLSREDLDLRILTSQDLVASIPDNSRIEVAKLNKDLACQLRKELENDCVIVGMGAGDIDTWLRNFCKNL